MFRKSVDRRGTYPLLDRPHVHSCTYTILHTIQLYKQVTILLAVQDDWTSTDEWYIRNGR